MILFKLQQNMVYTIKMSVFQTIRGLKSRSKLTYGGAYDRGSDDYAVVLGLKANLILWFMVGHMVGGPIIIQLS